MKYLKPYPMFNYLMKLKDFRQRPMLGLDVGKSFIGVAIADKSNRISRPLRTFNVEKDNVQEELGQLISYHKLSGIVLGWPTYFSGEAKNVKVVKGFADTLKQMPEFKNFHFTVWDENTTTKNAEFLVKPLKYNPDDEKPHVDMFAATCILQGYLDFVNCDKSQIKPWKLKPWSPDL